MREHIGNLGKLIKKRLRRSGRNQEKKCAPPLNIEYLSYSFSAQTIRLHIPELRAWPAASGATSSEDYLNDHLVWRMYTEPWKDGGEEAMIKASVKEIGIVRNAFPLVSRAEAVLAMAAWFSVLLLVDDLVEDMGTAQAHEALSTSIRILHGSSAAYPDEPEKPVAKVCHAVRSLWARINYLLDEPAANAMLMDIKACLEGQLEELQYRQLPCSSLSQYARVRRHTIGAMPFLTLVCLELNNHISTKDAKALTALKDLVVSIVFLQNDMVGLEKDLAEGTTMNTFMVMSHSRATSPVPTPENLLEVASQHNALVSEVLARYRTMFSLQSSDGYRLAAESVISFISTHLIWAKRSKRYNLG